MTVRPRFQLAALVETALDVRAYQRRVHVPQRIDGVLVFLRDVRAVNRRALAAVRTVDYDAGVLRCLLEVP